MLSLIILGVSHRVLASAVPIYNKLDYLDGHHVQNISKIDLSIDASLLIVSCYLEVLGGMLCPSAMIHCHLRHVLIVFMFQIYVNKLSKSLPVLGWTPNMSIVASFSIATHYFRGACVEYYSRRSRYTTSCGLFGWKTCTRYR